MYSRGLHSSDIVEYLGRVFDLFEGRILARGDGFQGLWLVYAASCLTQAQRTSTLWREQVANRILALCSCISMAQVQEHRGIQDSVFAEYMKQIQRTAEFARMVDKGSPRRMREI